MREKDLGIWQAWTWSQIKDRVGALAVGLAGLGVTRGDRVAIVGENRPRLYWSMCAAQLLGAIPVPMYQNSVAQEMTFLFRHAAARVAIVENQEQVDKLLEIRESGIDIRHILYARCTRAEELPRARRGIVGFGRGCGARNTPAR